MARNRGFNRWFVLAAVAVVTSVIVCFLVLRPGPEEAGPPPALPTVEATPSPSPGAREFEEAKAAYNRSIDEMRRIAANGGANEPTQELRDTLDDEVLNRVTTDLRELRKNRLRVVGQVPRRVDLVSFSPDQITILVCEDYRQQRVLDLSDQDVTDMPKPMWQQDVLMTHVAGHWKVHSVEGQQTASFDVNSPCHGIQ